MPKQNTKRSLKIALTVATLQIILKLPIISLMPELTLQTILGIVIITVVIFVGDRFIVQRFDPLNRLYSVFFVLVGVFALLTNVRNVLQGQPAEGILVWGLPFVFIGGGLFGWVLQSINAIGTRVQSGDYEKAVADSNAMLRRFYLTKTMRFVLLYNRAVAHSQLGNYSSALVDFEAIPPQKLDPLLKQSIAIRKTAILCGLGRMEEAAQTWQTVLKQEPRFADIDYVSTIPNLSETQIAQLKALIKA